MKKVTIRTILILAVLMVSVGALAQLGGQENPDPDPGGSGSGGGCYTCTVASGIQAFCIEFRVTLRAIHVEVKS
jgi:hypothetical protein